MLECSSYQKSSCKDNHPSSCGIHRSEKTGERGHFPRRKNAAGKVKTPDPTWETDAPGKRVLCLFTNLGKLVVCSRRSACSRRPEIRFFTIVWPGFLRYCGLQLKRVRSRLGVRKSFPSGWRETQCRTLGGEKVSSFSLGVSEIEPESHQPGRT